MESEVVESQSLIIENSIFSKNLYVFVDDFQDNEPNVIREKLSNGFPRIPGNVLIIFIVVIIVVLS